MLQSRAICRDDPNAFGKYRHVYLQDLQAVKDNLNVELLNKLVTTFRRKMRVTHDNSLSPYQELIYTCFVSVVLILFGFH